MLLHRLLVEPALADQNPVAGKFGNVGSDTETGNLARKPTQYQLLRGRLK